MRHPHQQDRKRYHPGQQTGLAGWLVVFAAMTIMLTGCVSTFLVLQLDEFRPKVGDVVVFKPGSEDAEMWEMNIPAKLAFKAAPTTECLLDPNVMAKNGGSLVVEGLRQVPSLQYQLHWAGQRTAAPDHDCGRAANVTVSRTDLQRLANAAGGFGIGDKGIHR